MATIDVLILMGSDSDAAVMTAARDTLAEFGLRSEMTVASAHRSPARVLRLVEEAPRRGVKVFVVGAGAAARRSRRPWPAPMPALAPSSSTACNAAATLD